MVNGSEHALDRTFQALADPTRRGILARLALGEVTVGELAEPLAISLPAVSKHVSVLERARLVSRRRQGRQTWCRLEPEALRRATDWLDHYRRFWGRQLDSLADYLERPARHGGVGEEDP